MDILAQDLWALMDFAQPGLLGNHATWPPQLRALLRCNAALRKLGAERFVKNFSEPIDKGSVRGAKAPWYVGASSLQC